MDSGLTEIFAQGSFLQLSGLLGLALFFVVMGFRGLRDDHPEGYLYLTVAVFLAVAHAVLLANLIDEQLTGWFSDNPGLWLWLVVLLAPALIVLFLLRAMISFIVSRGREGLIRLFFGLTLLCYLYLLGSNWPMDVRGILTIVWLGFLFKTELAIAN